MVLVSKLRNLWDCLMTLRQKVYLLLIIRSFYFLICINLFIHFLHIFKFLLFMLLLLSQFFPFLPPSTQPNPLAHNQSLLCCPCVIHTCSLTSPFPFLSLPSHLSSSYSYQSIPCFHISGSIYLISLFCSLDSSCKWGHMVFVFCHLAYFT